MPEKRKLQLADTNADADSDIESARFRVKLDSGIPEAAAFLPVKPDSAILPVLKNLSETTKSASSATLEDAALLPVKPDSAILPVLKNLAETTKSASSTPKTLAPSYVSLSSLQSKILNLAESLRGSVVGGSVSTVRKAAMILRVLDFIRQLSLSKRSLTTTKQLFFDDMELFKDKKQLEACVDDIACMLGCTWASLFVARGNIVQAGFVAGRLCFSQEGNTMDCSTNGGYGIIIPPNTYRVTDMQSDALFILLVDNLEAYLSLCKEKFYNRFPCVIITGNDKPELGARLFLMKMVKELKLPVLALVDCFPSGLKNLSAYGYGIDIKWLGLRPSDFDKYNLPTLPMTDKDLDTCENLLKKDSVKNNPGWVKELDLMVKKKQKAELYAFIDFENLSKFYLPFKLQQKDWL